MKNPVIDFAEKLDAQVDKNTETAKKEEIYQAVVFEMNREQFGIAIHKTREIIPQGALYRVPHAPRHIIGVTNLRGKVIPVVNLGDILGIELPNTAVQSRKIIIVDYGQRRIGLLVGEVAQLQKFSSSELSPPPPEILDERSFIAAVVRHHSKLIFLLEVDQLLARVK